MFNLNFSIKKAILLILFLIRLISSWKSDLNTSLAALEMLSGLARIHIPEQGTIRLLELSIIRVPTRAIRAFYR